MIPCPLLEGVETGEGIARSNPVRRGGVAEACNARRRHIAAAVDVVHAAVRGDGHLRGGEWGEGGRGRDLVHASGGSGAAVGRHGHVRRVLSVVAADAVVFRARRWR